MRLKIKARGFFETHVLELTAGGVKCAKPAALSSGKRLFSFREIDAVLMGPNGRLSLYAGREIFSIPTKPADSYHRYVVEKLVQSVREGRLAE